MKIRGGPWWSMDWVHEMVHGARSMFCIHPSQQHTYLHLYSPYMVVPPPPPTPRYSWRQFTAILTFFEFSRHPAYMHISMTTPIKNDRPDLHISCSKTRDMFLLSMQFFRVLAFNLLLVLSYAQMKIIVFKLTY